MKINNPEKYKDSKLTKKIPHKELHTWPHINKALDAVYELYECDPKEMEDNVEDNPWADLCLRLLFDIFPAFKQAKKNGGPLRRDIFTGIRLLLEYKILRQDANINEAKALKILAQKERDYWKLDFTPTKDQIRNPINDAKKFLNKFSEIVSDISDTPDLANLFTGLPSRKKSYSEKEAMNFLCKLKYKDEASFNLFMAVAEKKMKHPYKPINAS